MGHVSWASSQQGGCRGSCRQVAFAAGHAPLIAGGGGRLRSWQRRQLGRLLLQLRHDGRIAAAQRLEVGLRVCGEGVEGEGGSIS